MPEWLGLCFWYSYAPGLGQSSNPGGRPSDMDYAELIGHTEMPSIDENLNLDQLNGFGFNEFIQSYKPQ